MTLQFRSHIECVISLWCLCMTRQLPTEWLVVCRSTVSWPKCPSLIGCWEWRRIQLMGLGGAYTGVYNNLLYNKFSYNVSHRSAKHSPKGKEQKRKTRKKKKVLSLVLSSVLVFSLSLPLFLAICAQLVEIQIVGQDVWVACRRLGEGNGVDPFFRHRHSAL